MFTRSTINLRIGLQRNSEWITEGRRTSASLGRGTNAPKSNRRIGDREKCMMWEASNSQLLRASDVD